MADHTFENNASCAGCQALVAEKYRETAALRAQLAERDGEIAALTEERGHANIRLLAAVFYLYVADNHEGWEIEGPSASEAWTRIDDEVQNILDSVVDPVGAATRWLEEHDKQIRASWAFDLRAWEAVAKALAPAPTADEETYRESDPECSCIVEYGCNAGAWPNGSVCHCICHATASPISAAKPATGEGGGLMGDTIADDKRETATCGECRKPVRPACRCEEHLRICEEQQDAERLRFVGWEMYRRLKVITAASCADVPAAEVDRWKRVLDGHCLPGDDDENKG